MTSKQLLHAIGQIDPCLVADAAPDISQKKANKAFIKWVAMAACFVLIAGAIVLALNLRGSDKFPPYAPTVNAFFPSRAPQHYGSSASVVSTNISASIATDGLSVTAQLVETLPDTYLFFDDWSHCEYRLLRMKTVKLLRGEKMTEEFYYLVPVDFMTDFSLYDSFVILNMAQFGYDYSVLYNKTQGAAEKLDLVLFGYHVYGGYFMGEKFMAFDPQGNFDERLWTSNEAWLDATEHSWEYAPAAIGQAEEKVWGGGKYVYAHTLERVTGKAAKVLSRIKSFENGLFVPALSTMTHKFSPEVQFSATRYIDGFATNEMISIQNKSYSNSYQYTVSTTSAVFDEKDMEALPDLPGAYAAVVSAYENGEITPPHIINYAELTLWGDGIFGWYAKTPEGVIGIVRVTWRYYGTRELDDAYFIIECGDEAYRPIDRDDLLKKFGDYETTYIFEGEYGEQGKLFWG